MGILGLWQYIKKKYTLNDPKNSANRNKRFSRIYVDGTWLVFKLCLPIEKLRKDIFREVLKKNLLNRIAGMMEFIKPSARGKKDSVIFVFDSGTRPSDKIRLQNKDKNKKDMKNSPSPSQESFDTFFEMLENESIPMIISKGEADHEIKHLLCKNIKYSGDEAVHTGDSDFILFSKYIILFDMTILDVQDMLQSLGISKKELIDASFIAGNDYNISTTSFGAALKRIKSL